MATDSVRVALLGTSFETNRSSLAFSGARPGSTPQEIVLAEGGKPVGLFHLRIT